MNSYKICIQAPIYFHIQLLQAAQEIQNEFIQIMHTNLFS